MGNFISADCLPGKVCKSGRQYGLVPWRAANMPMVRAELTAGIDIQPADHVNTLPANDAAHPVRPDVKLFINFPQASSTTDDGRPVGKRLEGIGQAFCQDIHTGWILIN